MKTIPRAFRAFGRFLDGGLIANNPTLDALTEIHEHTLALKAKGREDEACPVTVVVSLGTGLIPVTEVKGIDVFRPESVWDSAKLVIGISFLGTLLVDQVIFLCNYLNHLFIFQVKLKHEYEEIKSILNYGFFGDTDEYLVDCHLSIIHYDNSFSINVYLNN